MSDVGSLSRAAGWQTKSIAELANHSLGKMLDKAKNRGEPQPYLRNLNVRWFDFDLSDVQEMRFQAGEEDRYSVHKGDLVICEGGYPGRAAIWNSDQPIYFQKALHRVRFHEPAHAKWCLYYLLSEDLSDRLRSNFNGTGIQHFTGEALARFRVPLPPLEETRRIVAILDEAFEGIATAKANAEKNLLNARELFSSQLERVFLAPGADWQCVALESIGITQTGSTPKSSEPENLGDYIPFVKPGDFNRDGSITFDNEGLSEVGARKARLVPANSALMVCIGATIGKAGFSDRRIATNQQINAWAPSAGVSAKFIYYQMTTAEFQRRVRSSSGQATLPIINKSKWSSLVVVVPPTIVEQQNIVAALDALLADSMSLETAYRRKLAALDELKKSLLHQAFTGQLTSSKPARVAQPATLQTTSPEFTANVIALAYARHARQMREKSFGRVKEQKTLHLVEAIAKIDLGRQPMRDAAGPNDFQHMLKAEAWAKANGFFEMVPHDGRYEFKKLSAFEDRMAAARLALAPYLAQLDSVIDLLVAMDKTEAEVFATVHAAWNNLLIEGAAVTDDAIVSAAREGWHADKLDIPEHRFRSAIELIRQKGLVPDGTAKYVGGQQSLL